MENKNMTAVEWLLNNLLINGLLRLTQDEHKLYKELKEQAKEMERKQRFKACAEAYEEGYENGRR
jgi:hypothetical protein